MMPPSATWTSCAATSGRCPRTNVLTRYRDRKPHHRSASGWATDRGRARWAGRREDAGQGLRGRLPPPGAARQHARIGVAFRPLLGVRVGDGSAEPHRRPLAGLLTSLAGLLAVVTPVLGVLRTFGVPGIVMGDSAGWQVPVMWSFPASVVLAAGFAVLAWAGYKLLRGYLLVVLAGYLRLLPFRAIPR
jgi:hypothetical protein